MFENIKLAFHGIWSHKLRSGLTMLGIIIGIASIIAIVSTIKGTNEQIKQNLIGAGNNSVEIALHEGDYPVDMSYFSVPDGVPLVSEEMRLEILENREIAAVTMFTWRNAYSSIFRGNASLNGGMLLGVDGHYFDVYGYVMSAGRGFVEQDFSRRRKVVILDETSASSLFVGENPLDKTIEILGEPFTVIGVVKLGTEFQPVINTLEDYYTYMNQNSGSVFIPDSAWPIIFGFDEQQTVAVRAASTDDMTSAGRKAADILNSYLDLPPESSITYKSQNLLQQAKDLQELSSATSSQLIWIASISLLVGGIGVMNIMLVSVTERVREIGLKKALGAKKRYILLQFLTEAAVLTGIGGLLGVISGVILASVVSRISAVPTSISLPIAALAVLFSTIFGILFGLLPAVQAANLSPIEALRRQ